MAVSMYGACVHVCAHFPLETTVNLHIYLSTYVYTHIWYECVCAHISPRAHNTPTDACGCPVSTFSCVCAGVRHLPVHTHHGQSPCLSCCSLPSFLPPPSTLYLPQVVTAVGSTLILPEGFPSSRCNACLLGQLLF